MKKIFVLITTLLFVFLSSSCDMGLEIVDGFISQYPTRIAYVLNSDTQLDLSGLEVTLITKDKNTVRAKWDDDYCLGYVEIIEEIDFSIAGVYVVTVTGHNFSCAFAIEVLDFAKLSS